MEQYHEIIQKQLEDGKVELAEMEVNGKEFYLPHKPLVKQSTETTKLRIVILTKHRP